MSSLINKDELYLSERQHAIVAQLGLAALSNNRVRDFQQIIIEKLINNLETDVAIISRIEPVSQSMKFIVSRKKLLRRTSQSLTELHQEMGIEAIALATDQPLLVENFDEQDEFPRPNYLEDTIAADIHSAVVVPLKGYRELLGTITVFGKAVEGFNSSDVHFLQSVASILSLAIERRRSERELEQSKEKLYVILFNIADGIFAQNKQGKILYANQAALVASGYSFPEGMQNELSESDRVELLTEALTQLEFRNQEGMVLTMNDLPGAKALETGRTQKSTIQFSGPNHRHNHWALIKASPVYNDKQQVEYVVNVLTDITDLKQTEQQLERYKERFELAQHSGSVGVYEWDIQADTMWWSSGEEVLFKTPPNSFGEEFLERRSLAHWQDRVHPLDRTRIRNKVMATIKQRKEDYENEFRIVYPNGEIRWLKANARIYYSPDGKPLRMIGVNFDITDRIRKEQRKDEFISMASHELKTPLTSIKAFNQMMLKKMDKGELNRNKFQDYLLRMGGQVNKLEKLVTDLLDVTKVQQGKLQLDLQRFNLSELLRELVITFSQTQDSHHLKLEITDSLEAVVDAHRIEQVVINLLTNAVKYSAPDSNIDVTLKKQGDVAVLSVQDFGIGISPEHQKYVTDRFFRVETANEAKYPGLGIGLYIARQIVEQHRGKLWFTSKLNRGSTFYVSIPLVGADEI